MRYQRPPFPPRRPDSHPRPNFVPRDRPPDDHSSDDDDSDDGSVRREAEYLRHLAEEKTKIVVHLVTGETFQGFIEYYDRRFIRLTRQGAPNLFIFKQDIKYFSEEQ